MSRRMKRNQFREPKINMPREYRGRNLRHKSRTGYKRCLLLLLFPLTLLILWICRNNTEIAENLFFRRIYRPVSIGYSYLTGKVPFSMYEIGLILLILLGIWIVVTCIRHLIQEKASKWKRFVRYLINFACIISVIYFVETLFTGVNYYRHSFTYYSGLTIQKSSEEELYNVCVKLANQANQLRAQTTEEDGDGVFRLSTNTKETARKANDAMENLAKTYPVLGGWDTVPKGILLSKAMSYTETTGIFCTFTMEANVDIDIADYSIPYTMCHELSHVRGFMREDEANFLGYLACVSMDDVEFQYCGTMLALIHCGNALYGQNPELYEKLRAIYSEKVVLDLAANNRYWDKYGDNVVSKISDWSNDVYLKMNNQKDGIKSYGRMVDLVLAYYREK